MPEFPENWFPFGLALLPGPGAEVDKLLGVIKQYSSHNITVLSAAELGEGMTFRARPRPRATLRGSTCAFPSTLSSKKRERGTWTARDPALRREIRGTCAISPPPGRALSLPCRAPPPLPPRPPQSPA